MISLIEALNFRSLRDVQQEVGHFQTLVGPNGSGKSTFLDVAGFIADLLKVGPFKAIVGDGSLVATRAVDPSNMCWMREGTGFEVAVELRIPPERTAKVADKRFTVARYEVSVHTNGPKDEVLLENETLWLVPEGFHSPTHGARSDFPTIHRSRPTIMSSNERLQPSSGWRNSVWRIGESTVFTPETTRQVQQENDLPWPGSSSFRLGKAKSGLASLPDDEERFPVAVWVKHVLMDGIQRVVLNAQAIRRPSPPGSSHRFLPDGSNLPWVVDHLQRTDQDRFERWIAHVRTAMPDVKTVSTVERDEDRHRYLVVEYENGLRAPSWVVSDGTLRMLALTLLAYSADKEAIYLIEEPENGIHPRAIETIYQSLSAVYDAQVFCASHSPVVLGLAKPSEILCFAKDEHGATDIVRGSEHPYLRNWKGTLDLGTLFASGVLE